MPVARARIAAARIAIGAVAAALALALSTLPGAAAPVVTQLAADVYTVSEGGYVSLAVVGEDGVLITDPASASRARALKQAVAGIAAKPITHIVLSHEHYDHVGGTELFPAAQVICHAACLPVFALDITGQAPDRVDTTFNDAMRVDFAGTPVDLYHYGPADGAGSIVLHLPERRIAFTADLYIDRELTHGLFMDDDNYLAIGRVLRELLAMDLEHAVNAHSDDTSPGIVEENLAFVEDLFQLVSVEVAKAMAAGGPAQVLAGMERWQSELKLPAYADWQGYDEHLPAHIRRMALSIFHGG